MVTSMIMKVMKRYMFTTIPPEVEWKNNLRHIYTGNGFTYSKLHKRINLKLLNRRDQTGFVILYIITSME